MASPGDPVDHVGAPEGLERRLEQNQKSAVQPGTAILTTHAGHGFGKTRTERLFMPRRPAPSADPDLVREPRLGPDGG